MYARYGHADGVKRMKQVIIVKNRGKEQSEKRQTHSPIFSCRSFLLPSPSFESFRCMATRYLSPMCLSNPATVGGKTMGS